MNEITIDGKQYELHTDITSFKQDLSKWVLYGGQWYREVEEESQAWEIVAYRWYDNDKEILEGEHLQKCLNTHGYVHEGYCIHSVKRLKDNCVFTIGDKVKDDCSKNGYRNIVRFEIRNLPRGLKQMWLHTSDGGGYGECLSISEKYEPEMMMRTEDGVWLAYNEEVWYVNPTLDVRGPYEVDEVMVKHQYDEGMGKYFSTEEAAKEYILNNKPVLSLNDVMKVIEHPIYYDRQKTLKELVKQKV